MPRPPAGGAGARGFGRRFELGLGGFVQERGADGAHAGFDRNAEFLRGRRRLAAGQLDADHVFGVEREVVLDGEAAGGIERKSVADALDAAPRPPVRGASYSSSAGFMFSSPTARAADQPGDDM